MNRPRKIYKNAKIYAKIYREIITFINLKVYLADKNFTAV